MIDIDFSREDIQTIRDCLRTSRRIYRQAIDSEIFDIETFAAMVKRVSEIESVLAKIDE